MTNSRYVEKKRRKGLSGTPLVDLPDWTIGEKKDGADLAAALMLAEFQDRWIRLSAESQRKVLGFVVFGKHAIHFDGQVFRVNHSAVGGGYTDSFTTAQITEAARAGRKL